VQAILVMSRLTWVIKDGGAETEQAKASLERNSTKKRPSDEGSRRAFFRPGSAAGATADYTRPANPAATHGGERIKELALGN